MKTAQAFFLSLIVAVLATTALGAGDGMRGRGGNVAVNGGSISPAGISTGFIDAGIWAFQAGAQESFSSGNVTTHGFTLVQGDTGQMIQSAGTSPAFYGPNGGFLTNTGSGTNSLSTGTNGARVDFGAGASDYATSDGTTVTFAGPLASASSVTGASLSASGASGVTALIYLAPSGATSALKGQMATSGTAVGATIGSFSNLTTAGDKLISVVNNASTEKAYVDISGTYANTATIGTAASGTGITANYSGWVRQFAHKITVINTAMAAAATTDVTIATTPVNTRITRVTADVTQVFTGGALSAVTVTCGNAAGGTQYLLSGSVFTAQTTLGDANAEIGLNLIPGNASFADMGTVAAGVPGAIAVSCRFTCTGANCSAATQGSVTFTVEGTVY